MALLQACCSLWSKERMLANSRKAHRGDNWLLRWREVIASVPETCCKNFRNSWTKVILALPLRILLPRWSRVRKWGQCCNRRQLKRGYWINRKWSCRTTKPKPRWPCGAWCWWCGPKWWKWRMKVALSLSRMLRRKNITGWSWCTNV